MATISHEKTVHLDPEQYRRKGNIEKWEELKKFFYDARRTQILGRDPANWVKVTLFYGAFYTVLLTFFTLLLSVYIVSVDEIGPREIGMNSPLKGTPGLAYRPMPDHESTLIRFEQGNPSTYKAFSDHIQTYLDQYENEKQVGENFIDCELGRPPDMPGKVCRFNVDKLGGDCTWQKDYGYDEGQPCVLLKINKIYGWMPETIKDENDIPPILGGRWHHQHIGVTCEGAYDADIENIGNITYNPPQGFPEFFYPYYNQEGYRAPLVMVRFNNPSNGVVINVICKAWAYNIRQHRNDQLGLVQFALLVD